MLAKYLTILWIDIWKKVMCKKVSCLKENFVLNYKRALQQVYLSISNHFPSKHNKYVEYVEWLTYQWREWIYTAWCIEMNYVFSLQGMQSFRMNNRQFIEFQSTFRLICFLWVFQGIIPFPVRNNFLFLPEFV